MLGPNCKVYQICPKISLGSKIEDAKINNKISFAPLANNPQDYTVSFVVCQDRCNESNEAWTLGSGVTVTVLSFLLWRPQQRVFFDRMCISVWAEEETVLRYRSENEAHLREVCSYFRQRLRVVRNHCLRQTRVVRHFTCDSPL